MAACLFNGESSRVVLYIIVNDESYDSGLYYYSKASEFLEDAEHSHYLEKGYYNKQYNYEAIVNLIRNDNRYIPGDNNAVIIRKNNDVSDVHFEIINGSYDSVEKIYEDLKNKYSDKDEMLEYVEIWANNYLYNIVKEYNRIDIYFEDNNGGKNNYVIDLSQRSAINGPVTFYISILFAQKVGVRRQFKVRVGRKVDCNTKNEWYPYTVDRDTPHSGIICRGLRMLDDNF